MDIISNKEKKAYEYLSRYSAFYYGYNKKDNKYVYELTKYLNKNNAYVTVPVYEDTNLDYLANKYYGRPDYFWIIADFNNIIDPFIKLSDQFTEIKIPSISTLEFED